jgi:hypothetical protein
MSLIACTCDCIYQKDGLCTLERAVSRGVPSGPEACVNYIPKRHKPPYGRL